MAIAAIVTGAFAFSTTKTQPYCIVNKTAVPSNTPAQQCITSAAATPQSSGSFFLVVPNPTGAACTSLTCSPRRVSFE